MKVALIQTVLSWESPESNFVRLDGVFRNLRKPDLIVLPEMFTTGFTMNTSKAEVFAEDSATLLWMKNWSKDLNAVITGSVAMKSNDGFYNRLLWVRPDGTFDFYDKKHTFGFAGEDAHYRQGNNRLIEHWKGFDCCPMVCYDLRFPVWSRNRWTHGKADYDVLIYVANWPAVRREAWSTLIKARAIENQCYVLAVNRVGTDPNGNVYSGDSAIISPKGEVLWSQSEIAGVGEWELDLEDLRLFREKFPVLKDGDAFQWL
jgi:predicted amidohydrolase